MPPLLKIIQTPKMAALLLLGFSSGLPLFLTSSTLQAWMKDANVDLGTIGWFSLAGLPYTLKFFWSPLLDRFVPPVLGRRRGWLIITQILLLVSIAPFGWHNPAQALQLIALNAILISFLSATQDIAGDAYRTDILSPHELGFGASTWVLGYRIAILISSSLALILADYLPWSVVYGLMALLMGVGIVTTLWAPEPASAVQPPDSVIEAVKLPFINFFTKFGLTPAFVLLVFILLYRLGDSLVSNMATPFLLDIGYSKTEIGAVRGTTGFLATILGVLGGGLFYTKLGLSISLWTFGLLQALSNLAYYVLSIQSTSAFALTAAINIENFCAGLVTAVFAAFLMSLCDQRFSATQYALLSSLMAVGGIVFASPAGELAKQTGWSSFFLITVVTAIPGLLLLPLVTRWASPVDTMKILSKD